MRYRSWIALSSTTITITTYTIKAMINQGYIIPYLEWNNPLRGGQIHRESIMRIRVLTSFFNNGKGWNTFMQTLILEIQRKGRGWREYHKITMVEVKGVAHEASMLHLINTLELWKCLENSPSFLSLFLFFSSLFTPYDLLTNMVL